MVGSVGQSNITPAVTVVDSSVPVSTDNAVEGLSSGYSDENSMSYAESENSGSALDSSVPLNAPATATVDSRHFLQKAFDVRLDGFRAIVSEFNAKFNKGYVDVADTQTLLMVVKGIVSDNRILLNANTVDQNASNRQQMQSKRENVAREQQVLIAEVKAKQTEIDSTTQQKNDKTGQLAQKGATKLLKENELANAQSSGDTSQASTLQGELAQITLQITLLEGEIANLSQNVTQLTSEKAISQASLTVVQKILSFATEDIPVVKQALGNIRERYDAAAMETGEEEALNAKRENRETEVQLSRETMRQGELKRDMKVRLKDAVKSERVSAEQQPDNPLLQGTPLTQSLLDSFAALSPVQITPQVVKEGSVPPTSEQVQTLAEALAIVLQAEPPEETVAVTVAVNDEQRGNSLPTDHSVSASEAERLVDEQNSASVTKEPVTATEKQPVNQAHLGDNRSLEGADNPQAFGLLLLEQNMAMLRENAGSADELLSVAAAENVKVAGVMAEQQKVDAMVAEALEEAEKADAAIRRSPV